MLLLRPELSPHGGDGDTRGGTDASSAATAGDEKGVMQQGRVAAPEAMMAEERVGRSVTASSDSPSEKAQPAAAGQDQPQRRHVQQGAGDTTAGDNSLEAGGDDAASSRSISGGTAGPAAPPVPNSCAHNPSERSTAPQLPSPQRGAAAAAGSRSASRASPRRGPGSGGVLPSFGSGSGGLLAAVRRMDHAGSGPLSFMDVMESFGVAAAAAAADLKAAEVAEAAEAGAKDAAAAGDTGVAESGAAARCSDNGRAAAEKERAAVGGSSSCGNSEQGGRSSNGTISRGGSSTTDAGGHRGGSRGDGQLRQHAQADGMQGVDSAADGDGAGGSESGAEPGAESGGESGAESEDVVEFLDATDGGPGLVMAEAMVDMHEVFHELPEQLAALQAERREAVVTPHKRRRLVARLSGLRLFRRALGPRGLLLRDKLTFLLGVSMLWCCAFWLGRSPSTFYLLYGGVGGVLMAARWASYFSRKWHYYLYDFCYYANLLLVLQLWLLPRWAPLAKVTFSYNTGPLAWSIITFRNSLVFHDLDKVTSLFLHLVPALVSWSLRWYGDPARFGPPPEATEQQRERWHRAGGLSNVLLPMASYVVWAVAYYLKIFVFSRAKIQQRGYRTLFNYVTSQKKGTFHAIARRIPPPLQPPVYLFLHLCFCMTTFLVALGCWYSFWAHTALLAAVASASIWHGGSYYFEVFARKYHEHLMPKAAGGQALVAPPPSASTKGA
ncbi:hypothetical protein HXX76_006471 [Chlamydomonas incerta]|uniref:Glycerophosphocholine acyltransferase 1 n=1 Tax=Chlamydomonas incerta TaxID=51695 RepID=A0A835TFQ3_CHLIN|nr:hypothetical protein HXX76_006471 [Chlamydomonas incerta]|eukprot:KAG2436955.1 hypothetical protein HXX76_006471 [Chlamydomonas incerta]